MKIKATITVLLLTGLYGLTYCLVREHIYVDKLLTWPEAQRYCRRIYDDLSTITTQEEIKHLPVTVPPSCPIGIDYYGWCYSRKWIGLYTDNANLTDWKWSGGENEPSCIQAFQTTNNSRGMCGLVFTELSSCCSAKCSWNLSFYCMEMYEVILVKKNKTWEEALKYCRNHYTDMASLKSDNWMKNAMKISMAAQMAYVWIGLRFLSGQWFWTTRNALMFQAWSKEGEPQCPARNLRCGALAYKEGIWQPRDCEEKLNFICYQRSQYQVSPSTTLQPASSPLTGPQTSSASSASPFTSSSSSSSSTFSSSISSSSSNDDD